MVLYIYYEDATEGFWGTTYNDESVMRIVTPVFRKKITKWVPYSTERSLFQKHFKTNAN